MFTRPGFDRDDPFVVASIAPFGPGRVNNDLGTRRGFVVPQWKPETRRARFWARVNKNGPLGCWLWEGHKFSNGYGELRNGRGGRALAHRFAFEELRGAIPDGLVLDHLCRVRHCVNPDHLEAVTTHENLRRGVGPSALNARKTHCIHGHEFTQENTYITPRGKRNCRACRDVATRKSQAAESPERHAQRLEYWRAYRVARRALSTGGEMGAAG